MKKSFAVVGLGRFGTNVALTLMESGAQVLAIDSNPECVKRISSQVTCAVTVNVCETESLKEAGLENMDGVVVAMGNNLEASAMTIITAKELGVPYILAKSNNDEAAKILSKIGADKVIYPEKDAGINVARKLLCSNFLEFFEISDNINVAEISVRPEWVGKTLKELDFRRSYNMNIILVKEDGRSIDHITPELQLKESYRLLVTISNEGLKRMMQ